MASSTCQVEAKHAVFLSLQDPVTKCDSIHLGAWRGGRTKCSEDPGGYSCIWQPHPNFPAQLGLRTYCFLQEDHLDPGSPFPQLCILGLTFPSCGKRSPGSFTDLCKPGPDKGFTQDSLQTALHFSKPQFLLHKMELMTLMSLGVLTGKQDKAHQVHICFHPLAEPQFSHL